LESKSVPFFLTISCRKPSASIVSMACISKAKLRV
jgi:hypothetical protein